VGGVSKATRGRGRALATRRRAATRKARRAGRRAVAATRSTLLALRRPALIVAAMMVVATVLGAGAFAATGFYNQYGAPRTPVNVSSWQLRPLSYATSDCRGCHEEAAAATSGLAHAQLLCEACHVPSIDHPGPVTGVVQMLPAPGESDCATCHVLLPGRPTDFAQVALESHYAGAECLSCHDPHTSTATKPREVIHPLLRLPTCATCHAPLGLKSYPVNHEPAPDDVCLSCHRPGAGSGVGSQ
jgi:hypothetical protein